jgi:hypothetical protein
MTHEQITKIYDELEDSIAEIRTILNSHIYRGKITDYFNGLLTIVSCETDLDCFISIEAVESIKLLSIHNVAPFDESKSEDRFFVGRHKSDLPVTTYSEGDKVFNRELNQWHIYTNGAWVKEDG